MRLSDVVAHGGLAFYAEVALILFFAVFVGVLMRVFLAASRAERERIARLPLDDGPASLLLRWWTVILWGTIAYSVLYLLNVPGIGIGKGRIANDEVEMARAATAESVRPTLHPMPAAWDDATLLALTKDPEKLAEGRRLFVANCTPCHREDAGGNIGPNLTDDYWIHGARPFQIFATASSGVADKGMPTWSQVLRPGEVAAVVAYVITLHGTHPPNPKPPQGTKSEAHGRD
jgi:cytochrome c oxidase cbb3-type subunit 3